MRYLLLLLLLVSCSRPNPNDERFTSSLRDDLSGVWAYPSEQGGTTSITVVEGHRWRSFAYNPTRIDTKTETNQSDSGEILGQEGVYYFANPTNFYSPSFFQKSPTGIPFMILSRSTYDRFMRSEPLPVQIWIRVADAFDPEKPPKRPSIEILGLPYNNIFEPKPK